MSEKTLPLTIYLLRADRIPAFEKVILGPSALPVAAPLDGYVVPLQSKPTQPPWVSVIQSVLQNQSQLHLIGQSPGALLALRHDANTFVITFGHAWAKLEDDWLEPEFGRRVALNSIAPDKLVEIHLEQVFAKWHIAHERAPRASAVEEFGVEFDRDLVASVEGVPSNSLFGKKLRGGTNLRLEVPFSKLREILAKSLRLFRSNGYKKHWPEIDNINVITDVLVIEKLEKQFDAELASGHAQKHIVMFTPTYRRVEAETVESYVFGRMSKSPATTPYLLVEAWMNLLEKEELSPSVESARATYVHLMDGNKDQLKKYRAFDCFGYEISMDGKQYVLSSGIWYEVALDFIERTNKAAREFSAPPCALPEWDRVEGEGEYNRRCCQARGYLLFDEDNLRFGGGQSQLEFCDILHPQTRTMFFVKNPSRSAGVSHLVEQVRRTVEMLFSADNGYRKELEKIIRQSHPQADRTWLQSRPRHSDWDICLVSMGRAAQQLPFFGRCGVVKLYKDLRERGHSVSFLRV